MAVITTISFPISALLGGSGSDGSAAANGVVPIGNGSGFVLAAIAGQTGGVTVTNGAGTITLSLVAADTVLTSLANVVTINPATTLALGGTIAAIAAPIGVSAVPTLTPTANSNTSIGSRYGAILAPSALTTLNLTNMQIAAMTTTGAASATVTTLKQLDVAAQGTVTSTTVTTAVGVDIGAITAGATNNYGLRIAAPSGGATINRAIDVAAGAFSVDGSGNVATTGTLATTGNAGIGSAVIANASLAVSGTVPKLTGGASYGIYATSRLTPDNGWQAYGVYVNNAIDATGLTVGSAYGIFVSADSKISGTITDAYGLYVMAPTIGGSGNTTAMFVGNSGAGVGTIGVGTIANNRPTANVHIGGTQMGTVPLLVNAITGHAADIAQFAVAGTVGANINQYNNIGVGGQNILKRLRVSLSGALDGIAEASTTMSLLSQVAHTTNPAGASYGLLIAETVSVTSGTTAAYVGASISAATKSGAGTYSLSLGLQVVASTFATTNYAATFTGGNVGVGTGSPTGVLHVLQIATGASALKVTTVAGGTVDIVSIDATPFNANAVITHWDKAGHLAFSQASVPTAVCGTAAGLTPPAATVVGDDHKGHISFTVAASPAGSNATLVTLTFKNAYGVAPTSVHISPKSGYAASIWGGATMPLVSADPTTTTFAILGGSTALTASGFVDIWYWVV